jgi:hypothetical protein
MKHCDGWLFKGNSLKNEGCSEEGVPWEMKRELREA